MCVEALAYGLLKLHRSEASLALMGTWQPDKMLKEMADTVHGVTGTRELTFNFEGFEPFTVTERRLDGPWVRKRYQPLGSLLHVPTLRQIETGTVLPPDAMRRRCVEIEGKLSAVLASKAFDIKLDRLCGWPCGSDGCTFVIEKDRDWFDEHGETTCPECGAIHIVQIGVDHTGKEYVKQQLRKANWLCATCGTVNYTPLHQTKIGAIITCSCCSDKFELFELKTFRAVKD